MRIFRSGHHGNAVKKAKGTLTMRKLKVDVLAVERRAELILQPFRHFTYVTAHSPTLPSLYLRHSSFSNPSVASPTLQLILQHFFRFSYVTGSSLTSAGELPMPCNNSSIPPVRSYTILYFELNYCWDYSLK